MSRKSRDDLAEEASLDSEVKIRFQWKRSSLHLEEDTDFKEEEETSLL